MDYTATWSPEVVSGDEAVYPRRLTGDNLAAPFGFDASASGVAPSMAASGPRLFRTVGEESSAGLQALSSGSHTGLVRRGTSTPSASRQTEYSLWMVGPINPYASSGAAEYMASSLRSGLFSSIPDSDRQSDGFDDPIAAAKPLLHSCGSDDYASLHSLNSDMPAAACEAGGMCESSPTISIPTAAALLAQTCLGAGALAIPYAFMTTGLGLGMALIVFVGMLSVFSFHILGESRDASGEHSYPDIAYYFYGTRALVAVQASLLCVLLGGIIAYAILIGDSLHPVVVHYTDYNGAAVSEHALLAYMMVLIFPLTLATSLRPLRHTTYLALVCLVYLLFVIALRFGQQAMSRELSVKVIQHSNHPSAAAVAAAVPKELVMVSVINGSVRVLLGVPIFMAAFLAQFNVVAVRDSLERPTPARFAAVSISAIAGAGIFYCGFGLLGYLSYGTEVRGDLLNNYSASDIYVNLGRVALTVVLACTYPLVFLPLRETTLGLIVTHVWASAPVTRLWFRIIVVLLLNGITYGVAYLAPNLSAVLALVGATCGNLLAFILPGMFGLKAFATGSAKRKASLALVVFGVVIGIAATAVIAVYWNEMLEKMGNQALSKFAYTVEEVEWSDGVWKVAPGRAKADGSEVTVFMADKQGEASSAVALELAERAARRLAGLRYPHMLAVVEVVDSASSLIVVTERVRPLAAVLGDGDLPPACKLMGVYALASALSFMHATAGMLHGGIGIDSVFVTPGLELRLGGLAFATPLTDPSELGGTMQRASAAGFLPSLAPFRAPEVLRAEWRSVGTPADVFALGGIIGCIFADLASEVASSDTLLSGEVVRALPPALAKVHRAMLSDAPAARPTVAQLAALPVFGSDPFVSLSLALDELAVQDDRAKARILARLDAAVETLPLAFCKYKAAPALAQSIEFGEPSAAVLAPLVKIGGRLDEDEFAKLILPAVIKLFSANDRAVRSSLLENLGSFAKHLPVSVVNSQIFPAIENGFIDRSALLRKLTLKSLLHLVDKLSTSTLDSRVLKHLARLQQDETPGIRANTTICLGKIAPHLSPGMQAKALIPAFTRAMRDDFEWSRVAGVKAMVASLPLFEPTIHATKILPSLGVLTIDGAANVRNAAFAAIDIVVASLKDHAAGLDAAAEASAAAAAANGATAIGSDPQPSGSGSGSSWFSSLKSMGKKLGSPAQVKQAKPTARPGAARPAAARPAAARPAAARPAAARPAAARPAAARPAVQSQPAPSLSLAAATAAVDDDDDGGGWGDLEDDDDGWNAWSDDDEAAAPVATASKASAVAMPASASVAAAAPAPAPAPALAPASVSRSLSLFDAIGADNDDGDDDDDDGGGGWDWGDMDDDDDDDDDDGQAMPPMDRKLD
ncbi:uncharacterized protein AMSG_12027 [Thecamonas trahens ATCC 50062]|uniref:Protein kinase domain-containing protein n=1 Tax=Thecamonas trahens ATCC 50062 TaxID=461836 RepID=A0A0L0DFC3_THETB|nr:hypothetical protein AMSG_12027 [Thecamonas trahens ATCC 50062]KNC51047.1 hypothetical protein AMSG_12027 [Thecamonas trahens ATCC 50062]|eukprot:XP_013756558.1 hypothetical protein AMSG_12027 [Thecamonas trahens ATCC 50062]